MSNEPPQMHKLYSQYLENPNNYIIANNFWGEIPRNIEEAIKLISKVKLSYNINSNYEKIFKIIKKNMKKLGIYTKKVEENFGKFNEGIIETGQQPNCLGGPSLILNKITYTETFASICKNSPLYFLGDYDNVQPELINTRVPSPSQRGMLLSYPINEALINSPIREVPNPSEEWLFKTLDKLESNYRGILRGIDTKKQDKVMQNLSHINTILRSTYYSTENVSEWSTKIIGTIINLEGNLGVPFFFPSDPEIRKELQSGYELLLSESNRLKFIEETNNAVELLSTHGYRAQIGLRNKNYVPFFYECQTKSCNKNRVELTCNNSNSDTITGKCPKCGEIISFSYNSEKPDLSDIVEYISPRVDSRQIVMDSILPIVAHVGGPGETSYYAEVYPGIKSLKLPSPIFTRYTRIFYNTPWNEQYSKNLIEKNYQTLMNEKLFKALANWVEAKKNSDFNMIRDSHESIEQIIEETYQKILEKKAIIENKINDIKLKLRDQNKRQIYLNEIKILQAELNEVDRYLSSTFGHFAPEKYGQEVNWLWVDLGLISGIQEIIKIYKRLYNRLTPNSSTFFVNL